MTILKKLTYSVAPTRSHATPEEHRRNKLIAKLNEQKAIAEADQNGVEYIATRRRSMPSECGGRQFLEMRKRIKRWWQNDAAGNCLLVVRYGNKILELEKGKAAIVVGKIDQLIPTIETVVSAIMAGELDAHLAQAGAARIVKRAAK